MTKITDLVDQYGDLDAQIKALTAKKDAIKKQIEKRNGESYQGSRWAIERSTYVRKSLDTSAIKELLGDEYDTYTQTSICSRISVRALPRALDDVA